MGLRHGKAPRLGESGGKALPLASKKMPTRKEERWASKLPTLHSTGCISGGQRSQVNTQSTANIRTLFSISDYHKDRGAHPAQNPSCPVPLKPLSLSSATQPVKLPKEGRGQSPRAAHAHHPQCGRRAVLEGRCWKDVSQKAPPAQLPFLPLTGRVT